MNLDRFELDGTLRRRLPSRGKGGGSISSGEEGLCPYGPCAAAKPRVVKHRQDCAFRGGVVANPSDQPSSLVNTSPADEVPP
jgi:hypothetical protein